MATYVRAEVEEELGEYVDSQEAIGADMVVGEAHDDEEDGEDDESAHLNGLPAEGVKSGDRDPIPGDRTGKNDDHVTDSGVV